MAVTAGMDGYAGGEHELMGRLEIVEAIEVAASHAPELLAEMPEWRLTQLPEVVIEALVERGCGRALVSANEIVGALVGAVASDAIENDHQIGLMLSLTMLLSGRQVMVGIMSDALYGTEIIGDRTRLDAPDRGRFFDGHETADGQLAFDDGHIQSAFSEMSVAHAGLLREHQERLRIREGGEHRGPSLLVHQLVNDPCAYMAEHTYFGVVAMIQEESGWRVWSEREEDEIVGELRALTNQRASDLTVTGLNMTTTQALLCIFERGVTPKSMGRNLPDADRPHGTPEPQRFDEFGGYVRPSWLPRERPDFEQIAAQNQEAGD
jgi:hypothetical protein